jgi:TfoX/Sxy family transcriptional regulator of competence genes
MSLAADLMAILLDAADGLPLVEKKRMFGFEALWGDGRIFALVWQGRISLRLPDRADAAELARVPGATALTIAEGKTSPAGQRWINVPESFHDDPHELRRWVGRAYDLALLQPLPPRRKRRARRA